jgi:hypothetical protein
MELCRSSEGISSIHEDGKRAVCCHYRTNRKPRLVRGDPQLGRWFVRSYRSSPLLQGDGDGSRNRLGMWRRIVPQFARREPWPEALPGSPGAMVCRSVCTAVKARKRDRLRPKVTTRKSRANGGMVLKCKPFVACLSGCCIGMERGTLCGVRKTPPKRGQWRV